MKFLLGLFIGFIVGCCATGEARQYKFIAPPPPKVVTTSCKPDIQWFDLFDSRLQKVELRLKTLEEHRNGK